MGKQLAALAALVGACMLAAGCTNVVDGTAVAADKSGPLHQDPIPVSALEGLLLDLSQINAALGATSMKVWFNAKAMWDWSKSVADKNCLAIDGPAQEKVYAGTGWTAMRGQRLDDSIDDSKKRDHYAIQAVVGFPTAHDAEEFYSSSVQSWSSCSNRRFVEVTPGQDDANLTYAGSLSNLLWRGVLRRHNVDASVGEYTRLGLCTVPAALAMAVLALWASAQVLGI